MLATTTPSLPALIGLIAGWYLVLPLIVRSKLPRGKAWVTEPFDPARHHTSLELSDFLRVNVARLADAGFQQVGDLVHHSSMTTTRVALLTHPDGVMATVVVLSRERTIPGKLPVTVMQVEFTAVMTTGTVLDVNNSPSLPIFAARPDHVVYRLPQVRDPLRLYRIYQVLLQRSFSSATLAQQDASDPVQYLKRATEREYRRQLGTGYYRYDEQTDSYILTLKGAYLAAWKLMIPFRWIRAELFARKSRALMREIGMMREESSSPALERRA